MKTVCHLRQKMLLGLVVHLAILTSAAVAADFEMSLQVKSATQQLSTKFTAMQPSPAKAPPRPVFTTKTNETLQISWKATNVAKNSTFPDVLIHCLVVAEKQPGQLGVPNLNNAAQESALTMDFKPGDSATGEFSLKLDKPGPYLVRIETGKFFAKYAHEHHAELDLICK